MNRQTLLICLAVIAVTLVSGKKGFDMFKQRGLRLNNPGNIRHSKDAWVGKSAIQKDNSFVTFDTPEHGIRALYKNLMTYRSKGFSTIENIITRWAPASENNTKAYISSIVKSVGLKANVPIPLSKYPDLIAAIIKHENGVQPYSKNTILRGVSMS